MTQAEKTEAEQVQPGPQDCSKAQWMPPSVTVIDLLAITQSGICGIGENSCASNVLS